MRAHRILLATAVVASWAGCFKSLDISKIPCDPAKADSCPSGYVCTSVAGEGYFCRRPTDAAADVPAVVGEVGGVEVGRVGEVAASHLDGAGIDGAGEAGGPPRIDGALDSTTDGVADVPLGGGETGGSDLPSGMGGAGGGDGPVLPPIDSGRDIPIIVSDGGMGGIGGIVGTGGMGGTGGASATGGATGTGGASSTGGAASSGGATSTGGVTATGGLTGSGGATGSGGTTGTGGAIGTGGATGTGGAIGTGGATGTGGSTGCSPACSPDEDCLSNSCVLRWGGMTCTSTPDCPSWATCCDGSNQSCDGTRLPAGDGTNPGQFVVSGDGLTVTDTITGLVWQRDGSGTRAGCGGSGSKTCNWAQAKAYCAGLALGGVSGWRLPAQMELSTILDFTRAYPTIDPAVFPDTPTDYFWTSSLRAGSSGLACHVDFDYGFWGCIDAGLYLHVRCVR